MSMALAVLRRRFRHVSPRMSIGISTTQPVIRNTLEASVRDVRREAGRDCWDGFRNPLYGRQFPPNSCGARPIAATPTESIAVALPFQPPGRRWRSSSAIPMSTFRASPGTSDQRVRSDIGAGNASLFRPSLRDGTTGRPKPLGAVV